MKPQSPPNPNAGPVAALADYTGSRFPGLRAAMRWHVPLMSFAALMAVLVPVAVIGLVVDDRVLVGAPIWAKPLKFALSFVLYSVAWAWMIAQLTRLRRTAWWGGTFAAVAGLVEMLIIVGQTVRGHRSHFNQTTPFDGALWQAMGMTIAVLWVASLVVSLILFVNRTSDRANTWAIRFGAILALAGMGLGFLMVMPTAQQIATDSDIVGAHSVGVEDGGPGLPLIGWSTTGGDLRIPHFVGMHALQLLPVFAMLLGWLATRSARRYAALRVESVRLRLVVVATVGYVGLLALVTWQALRGQSIVDPDLWTGLAFAVLVIGTAIGARAAIQHGKRVLADQAATSATPPHPAALSTATAPAPRGDARPTAGTLA